MLYLPTKTLHYLTLKYNKSTLKTIKYYRKKEIERL